MSDMTSAIADLNAGRRAEAELACAAALAKDPDNEIALQIMGVLCGDAGDLKGAEAWLRHAAEVSPRNPLIHNTLGVMLKRQGRLAEALACYEVALALDSGLKAAQDNRVIALREASGGLPDMLTAAVERAVYGRAPGAVPLLVELLLGLARGNLAPPSMAVATRLAAATGALFTDPAVPMDRPEIGELQVLAHTLHYIFALTPFVTTDHLLVALGAGDTERFAALAGTDRPRFIKAALLFGLNSRLPIDPEVLFACGPDVALPFYLSQLATRFVFTGAGAARRERLLELSVRLPDRTAEAGLNHISMLVNAWMNCSYAARPDKHAVKRPLNRILRNLMRESGISDAPLATPRARPERPAIVVAAEVLHARHVQFRYLAPYLRQLRASFRLVLLTEKHDADTHVRALFDEVLILTVGTTAADWAPVVASVIAARPDIVFWLSVGMKHWGPPLANLRLAPIQIAGLGHSATTHCDSIDYYMTEAGFVARPDLLSEQAVLLPDAGLRFAVPPEQPAPIVSIRPRAEPARVAIASNLLKLNPGFVDTLREIGARANRPVVFELFPNSAALDHAAARAVVTAILPGAIVHPVFTHPRYLAALSDCDLSFSPFPFGGMHSVVDSLRLGLPVLAMDSLDLHGQTDRMLLRLVGMPDWLVARDAESYIAAAVRLIEEDDLRVSLSRQAAALDIDSRLFETEGTSAGTDVADAMRWLIRNHEAIKASGRKAFGAVDWRGDGFPPS